MTPTPATTGTPNISLAGGLLLAAAWVLDVPRCDVPGQFRRPGQVTYRATPRTAGPGTPLRWPLDLSRFQASSSGVDRSRAHDAQRDALQALGVSRIFADKMPGVRDDRMGYRALLDYVRPGDTIVVTALDRLGRSLTSIVNTVSDLGKRGIYVRTLRESIDTSTSVGRMLAGLFASLAEYERELIAERARVARQAAAARGKLPGRPRKLPADKVALALRMRAAGKSAPTIAQALGVSRATLYRALERVTH